MTSPATPQSPPAPSSPATGDVRTRLLEATYRCIAEKGLAATSLEDASRAAGVSRATLYRYFPGGREELLGAVISWETLRFFERMAAAVEDAADLESLICEGMAFAHKAIREHAVLQRILGTEPGLLTPQLTTDAPRIIHLLQMFFRGRFGDYTLSAEVSPEEAAEYVARMVLSFIASPGRWELSDPDQVRELVRSEILAGLVG